METVKEKLAKIFKHLEDTHGDIICGKKDLAESLVAHGVTIQEWVSVDERLPEESLNSVLGWDKYRDRCVFVQYYKGEWILGDFLPVKIIAWMPLPLCPQPPKEVQ